MAWEWHDASDFYKSHVAGGRRGAAIVLGFRVLLLLSFIFGLLFQALAGQPRASGLHDNFLNFFTNWTFVGFGLYSILACFVSSRGLHRSTAVSQVLGRAAPESMDALDKALAIVGAAIPASSIFLTAFYWAVLHDSSRRLQLENAQKHGGTVILFFIEYAITRSPLTSTWLIVPIIYSGVYMIFLWIFWGTDDHWVYDVLDWREPRHLVYYGVLPVLVLLAFWFLFGLVCLRERIAARWRLDGAAAGDGGKRDAGVELATRPSGAASPGLSSAGANDLLAVERQ